MAKQDRIERSSAETAFIQQPQTSAVSYPAFNDLRKHMQLQKMLGSNKCICRSACDHDHLRESVPAKAPDTRRTQLCACCDICPASSKNVYTGTIVGGGCAYRSEPHRLRLCPANLQLVSVTGKCRDSKEQRKAYRHAGEGGAHCSQRAVQVVAAAGQRAELGVQPAAAHAVVTAHATQVHACNMEDRNLEAIDCFLSGSGGRWRAARRRPCPGASLSMGMSPTAAANHCMSMASYVEVTGMKHTSSWKRF